MSRPSYDTAIVGGGLAGCSAAIHLARTGVRVALFEAKTYPHHKVCGEVLSPECTRLLDELGLTDRLQTLGPARMDAVCVTAPNGAAWTGRLPGVALGISRYQLDHLLAQQALQSGVDVYTSTTVTDIYGTLADSFQVITRAKSGRDRFQVRAVIAAHGKRGSLDRTLNRRFLRQPQPFLGLKAHFYGPPLSGRIELHTFPGGYCGLSEIEDGKTNVCLLVRDSVFKRAGGLETFIGWIGQQNPRLGAWLAAAEPASDRWYSISQVPFVNKRQIENDILMAGDSAGLIAPLAGNGMAMALQGGKLAAAYTGLFLRDELSPDVLRRQYPAAWQREFWLRLRLGRLLQTFMLRPQPLALGLHLMNAVPLLGHFFIHQTRDVRFMVNS